MQTVLPQQNGCCAANRCACWCCLQVLVWNRDISARNAFRQPQRSRSEPQRKHPTQSAPVPLLRPDTYLIVHAASIPHREDAARFGICNTMDGACASVLFSPSSFLFASPRRPLFDYFAPMKKEPSAGAKPNVLSSHDADCRCRCRLPQG